MYRILRPLLFLFDAEKVHHLAFRLLRTALAIPPLRAGLRRLFSDNETRHSREVFGLRFPNPVGLAAGFDKDAWLNEKWDALGFGFAEIGTIVPRPQPGNPLPRLFRLPEDHAIINRMGFNSGGLEAAVERLKRMGPRTIILGGNIGKNKATENDQALDDYLKCFESLYPYVDYFTVNVSSPNTPGLRELQEKEPLTKLLLGIQEKNRSMPRMKPVLLKIAPDLTEGQVDDILSIVKEAGLAGIVATNTTISREGLQASSGKLDAIGGGGLSGAPLTLRSREMVRMISRKTAGQLPIIGVGGIMTPEDAQAMLDAGASLVQVYSGFIYQGPGFVRRILKRLAR